MELTSDLYDLVMSTNRLVSGILILLLLTFVGQRGRAIHMLNVGAKKRKQPDRSNQNQFSLSVPLIDAEVSGGNGYIAA